MASRRPPARLPRRVQMRGKALRIGQRLERGAEAQLTVVEGVLQGGQEEPAEEARQHADRQEEARSARDPARPVRREAAAGDDAMEMRMMDQRLSPRVQDGEEADRGAQVRRIGGDGRSVSAVARKRIP